MDQETAVKQGRRIPFKFQPFRFENNEHFIEKLDQGVRRRYLRGISSGILRDGHGEHMTMKCIEGMHTQGRSGHVLLYAGKHDVNFIDDLGKLTDSDVVNGKDWLTEYRLYDALDGFNPSGPKLENSDTLWRQIKGVAPYDKPIQKGFSIEGIVPEEAILDKDVMPDGSYQNRVIDHVILDGVVVVNRPAYEDSVVTAVCKCLEILPEKAAARFGEKVKKQLTESLFQDLVDKETADNFYSKLFRLNQVLEEKISDIMGRPDSRNRERLEILLDQYKLMLVDLVMTNASVFLPDESVEVGVSVTAGIAKDKRSLLIKQFAGNLTRLGALLQKRV